MPAYPDWQQLKELLDECSSPNSSSAPKSLNQNLSTDTVLNIPCESDTTESKDSTLMFVDKIKKLEEIIKEQNQIIRVKNAYINILERKLKQLKEKLPPVEDTTYLHVTSPSFPDMDVKTHEEIGNTKSIQKIADLHQYLQDIHEQVRLLKKHKENP